LSSASAATWSPPHRLALRDADNLNRLNRKDVVALAGAAVVVLGALTLWARSFGLMLFPTGVLRDFNAFYCGGDTLNHGANPFLAEPLGACERIPKPGGLFSLGPNLVMPVPHPGYVLALFMLFAKLPFVPAAIVWTSISLTALALAIVLLRRITGFPPAACFCACALSAGYASLALGQVVPLALAAIVGAGYALSRGNDLAAAGCGALSMIEPHVGLPLCLGLFIWRSKTRIFLIASAMLFAGISIAVLGSANTLAYLHTVLPAHALSEVPNIKQLSLTYVAHRLGANDELAVRIGDLSYLLMLALGVGLAGALAKRAGEPALIATVPPAFGVLGGPFVHVIEISVAVPAALILAARFPKARLLFASAATVLAIPWTQCFNLGAIFPVYAALAVGIMTYDLISRKLSVVVGVSLATIAYLMALFLMIGPIPSADGALAAHYDPSALSQASWGLYVRIVAGANVGLYDLARIPSWIALIALAYGAITIAARPGPKVAA
jgi:hypothetical protein